MLSPDLILKEIQIKMEVSLGSRTSGWISGFDNSLVGNKDPDAGSKWVVINPGLLRVRVTKTPLVRNLSSETLTTTNADTDSVVLCTCSKGEAQDCD